MEEIAVFGGGCFWCTEAAFSALKGVSDVKPGYAGGATEHPSYESVCTGKTGHAEVIRVAFDSSVITFKDLLSVFFTVHDPTTLNRQGHDIGTQYRSVIFTTSPEQAQTAKAFVQELHEEKIFDKPIVTEILPLPVFYPAEAYHERYYEKNPNQGYCSAVIAPKLKKLRTHYTSLLR